MNIVWPGLSGIPPPEPSLPPVPPGTMIYVPLTRFDTAVLPLSFIDITL